MSNKNENNNGNGNTQEDGSTIHPRSLNELLRLSIKYHDTEIDRTKSDVQPMDEERKKFLSEAIRHVTVNEFEEMQKSVLVLQNIDSSDDQKEEALESISYFTENLDLARDLQTIGGFNVVLDQLRHENSNIVWKAADVIASVTQNEPKCQIFALQQGTLHLLFDLLDHKDQTVRKKSVYAISALVRQNISAQKLFLNENGIEKLKKSMKDSNAQVQTKAVFLFNSLCLESEAIVEESSKSNVIDILVELLKSEDETLREHTLSTLCTISENSQKNRDLLLSTSFNLKEKLIELESNPVGEEAHLIANLKTLLKL